MTDPITPPPELVEQWYDACILEGAITYGEYKFAAFAALWGADQELEACCIWVSQFNYDDYSYQERLQAARRRPKPPTLKEQALLVIDTAVNDYRMSSDAASIIRRALEALDD